jgi:hypothetical protein
LQLKMITHAHTLIEVLNQVRRCHCDGVGH